MAKRTRGHVWSHAAAERPTTATVTARRAQARFARPVPPPQAAPAPQAPVRRLPSTRGFRTAVGRRRIPRAVLRGATILGALLLIVLAVAVVAQPGHPPGAPGFAGGGTPGASSAASLFNGTFDEFSIDSRLPEPWQVTDPASATIVALPTSADRSVRLRSSSTGAAVHACRPITDALPDVPLLVQLDVLVESLPRTTPSPLLTLEHHGQTVAGIQLEPSGAVADGTDGGGTQPSGGNLPSQASASSGTSAPAGGILLASHWYHLSMALDRTSRTYTWQALRADAAPLASAGPEPLADATAASVDAVCIASPAGARSGAILVNDLLVRE